MAYSDFKTLNQVISRFNLQLENRSGLFSDVEPIQPSERLQTALEEGLELAANIGTEKAKSELIVTPILLEVRRLLGTNVSYFSGSTLTVDPEAGLNGECDFILSHSQNQIEITQPILTVVEAKNDNIKSGLGQCVAQMLGAKRFNELTEGTSPIIVGAVTTGEIWKFLQLSDDMVQVDLSEYFINQLPQILGLLAYPFHELAAGAGARGAALEVL